MESEAPDEVSKVFAVLSVMQGELVWFVRLSADNVLRMDFGEPHLKIREPTRVAPGSSIAVKAALERRIVTPTGRWHLFVTDGEWSVETRFATCRRSDTAEKINPALNQLEGQRLVATRFLEKQNGWRFEFDLGGILTIVPSYQSNVEGESFQDQWTLFFDNGDYVFYTNDGKLKRKGEDGG